MAVASQSKAKRGERLGGLLIAPRLIALSTALGMGLLAALGANQLAFSALTGFLAGWAASWSP
jgi:hypothetical protein